MKWLFFIVSLAAQTRPPWTMLRLPDTGQTRRYSTAPGDDASFTINPLRYRIDPGGIVADLVTTLEWQQADGGEMKWDAAAAYCSQLSLGGHDDWRLPYAHELFSIQNHGVISPAIDTAAFTRTTAEYWWSIETRADSANFAWATNSGGGIGAHPISETVSAGGTKRFHARCVRHNATGAGDPAPFTDNQDGTVSDNRTGLMWHKSESASTSTWEESFGYAAGLRTGNYADWRVPNIKELRSLHSDYALRPSIDTAFFPGAAAVTLWSSTTQIGQNGVTAWTLDFNNGVVSYTAKTERLRVRAVRLGSGPRIAFNGIRNAASYAGGAIAPGEIITLFGTAFGVPEGRSATVVDGKLTSSFDGHSVRINGAAAPIVGWQDSQISVVVPEKVAAATNASVSIEAAGVPSPPMLAPVASASPGVFTGNASGSGQAAAFNEDGSINNAANPARPGSIVVLYGTGHGALDPALPDGAVLAGISPKLKLPVEVRIGEAATDLLYSGLAFGLPVGLLQLNVRVPLNAAPNATTPIEVRIGDRSSQPSVTLAIR